MLGCAGKSQFLIPFLIPLHLDGKSERFHPPTRASIKKSGKVYYFAKQDTINVIGITVTCQAKIPHGKKSKGNILHRWCSWYWATEELLCIGNIELQRQFEKKNNLRYKLISANIFHLKKLLTGLIRWLEKIWCTNDRASWSKSTHLATSKCLGRLRSMINGGNAAIVNFRLKKFASIL